jgi:hypothetical protein
VGPGYVLPMHRRDISALITLLLAPICTAVAQPPVVGRAARMVDVARGEIIAPAHREGGRPRYGLKRVAYAHGMVWINFDRGTQVAFQSTWLPSRACGKLRWLQPPSWGLAQRHHEVCPWPLP